MAKLTQEEFVLHQSLYALCKEPQIYDVLVKYARIHYDNALIKLKNSKDLYEIGKLQGEILGLERFLNLKALVTDILSNTR